MEYTIYTLFLKYKLFLQILKQLHNEGDSMILSDKYANSGYSNFSKYKDVMLFFDEEFKKFPCICKLIAQGKSNKDIANILGRDGDTNFKNRISDIRHGRAYNNILANYMNN